LSIEDISRLWSEEAGLDPSTFKKDLEEWFTEFVKQTPASQSLITGRNTDTANRPMGMVGAHLVERTTIEAYCEERGYSKPRFWFGGRVEGSPRDKPSQSEPAEISPEATPPQPSEEQSSVRDESDPEAAFRAQVARMSEKLKTLWDESPDVSRQSVTDHQGLEAGSGQTGTSAEPNQQELIERADAAEAHELKAQLEVAEQRIADLTAEAEASRASSMARPYGPVPASPEAPFQEPKTSPGFLRRGSENYEDSSATRRMPRQTTARRKGRGRVILVAGLAIPLVALLFWGVETMIQPAGNEQIPPTTETADPMAGSSSVDGGQPPVQPETAALPLEPATGKLDLGGAVPHADEQDLTAAQRQIARLSAAVEASDTMIVRLRDALLVARQEVETARQTTPAEPNLESAIQQRELMLAATVSSARVVALQRELETARHRIADLSKAVGSGEDAAAKLREELSARKQDAAASQPPAGPGATAPSDQNPVANQTDPDQVQDAEISSDPVTSETDALRDTVSLERLLLEPGDHVGREVVVTGSVIWLVRRYWLQSDSGQMSMMIDVEGLHSDDRTKLKDAVVQMEFLVQVRARITGTIERQESEHYHLAATELVLVE